MRAHSSAVTDFYDNEHVQATLYPEYENLIRSLVPEAEHVFVDEPAAAAAEHDGAGL